MIAARMPLVLEPRFEDIPEELQTTPQWVVWKLTPGRNGKPTKIPFNPATGKGAYTADGRWPEGHPDAGQPRPSGWRRGTWARFGDARKAAPAYSGVGIVFDESDPNAGVDLDNCRDPATGKIEPWAQEIIDALDSYAEISPSGTGVKIFCRGSLPGDGRKFGNIEMYDRERYFAVTGWRLPGAPAEIRDCTAELHELYAQQVAIHGVKNGQHVADDHAPLEVPEYGGEGTALDIAEGERQVFALLVEDCRKPKDGDRSTADFRLCKAAHKWQWPKEAVWQAVQNVGKFSERSRDSYFEPTWTNAYLSHLVDVGQENVNRVASRPDAIKVDVGQQDLAKVTAEAWAAISATNEPATFFRYGGQPARLEQTEEAGLLVATLGVDGMRYELAKRATCVRWQQRGDNLVEVPAVPGDKLLRNMLAEPEPPIPTMTRIVEAPVFSAEGRLQIEPGYHAEGRTYFSPAPGFTVPEVSRNPLPDEIDDARDLLLDNLLYDFPFVGDAERAHAFALLLLPFVRDLIDGPTPLHLVEKPTPGTGATLLVDMLAFPSTGRPLATLTEGNDEDEWRKRITSKLRTGPTHLLLDNLRRTLDSAAVAAAITSPLWEDRLLGASTIGRFVVRCCWIATANNPSISNEIARRTIRIRLDSRQDRPWLREGFRHPDLRRWAADNRGRLVWACLTLGQAWLAAGRPMGKQKLGMFEGWAATMGGILDVARVPGFLANITEFYDQADVEGQATRAFIEGWWERHETATVTVGQLYEIANSGEFDLGLGNKDERSRSTRLGFVIRRLRDRVFSLTDAEGIACTVIVQNCGTKQRASAWRLATPRESTASPASQKVALWE